MFVNDGVCFVLVVRIQTKYVFTAFTISAVFTIHADTFMNLAICGNGILLYSVLSREMDSIKMGLGGE